MRWTLVALAAVAVAVGAHTLRAEHRCDEARETAERGRGDALRGAGAGVADRCGDPADRARAAVVLVTRGRRDEALEIARRMTTDAPDDYVGWIVLYRLTDDPAALARARELNPRGAPRR